MGMRVTATSKPAAAGQALPALASVPANGTTRCRCGTRLPHGSPCLKFASPPSVVQELVGQERFCSGGCARAYLLEGLELLDVSTSASVLADRDQVRVAFSQLYAQLKLIDN